jgi:hypothetical protein
MDQEQLYHRAGGRRHYNSMRQPRRPRPGRAPLHGVPGLERHLAPAAHVGRYSAAPGRAAVVRVLRHSVGQPLRGTAPQKRSADVFAHSS